MSESSRTNTDGAASETLNVEDLFATEDTDISIDDSETTTAKPGTSTTTAAAAEDTTAGEVFAQLREDVDDDPDGARDDADESPADIMARADEETQHVDQIDDAIRADEAALDDLLLTGRREADGFLWVEAEDNGDDGSDVASLFESSDHDATDSASLFESTDHDATDSATGTGTDDATNDSADGTPDDDFALNTSVDSSFEARAASFEDTTEEFRTEESNAGGATQDDSEITGEAGTGESTDDTDSTHETDGTNTEPTPETPNSGDSGDEEGGLASRIRSILSG